LSAQFPGKKVSVGSPTPIPPRNLFLFSLPVRLQFLKFPSRDRKKIHPAGTHVRELATLALLLTLLFSRAARSHTWLSPHVAQLPERIMIGTLQSGAVLWAGSVHVLYQAACSRPET